MFDYNRISAQYKGFRVIGDIHGEFKMFLDIYTDALANNLYPISIGDLMDRGPDSDHVISMAVDEARAGRMAIIMGNHDDKFYRWASGNGVKVGNGLQQTIDQINANSNGQQIVIKYMAAAPDYPLWAVMDKYIFVHGGFHPGMLNIPYARYADKKTFGGLVSRAIYGQVDGFKEDGYPNRIHDWVDTIPPGYTVFVGHEVVGDEILIKTGEQGGTAIFTDTGSGKGGKLSYVDEYFG